jgi:hypothetical protein
MSDAMNLLMFRVLPSRARRELLLRKVRIDERQLEEIQIYPAQDCSDVKSALSLIHETYAGQGKIQPNPVRLHVTKHNAQPASLIFVARRSDRVVGTMSLVPDSPLGLPADSMQRERLDSLRAQGLKICEIGGAVCDLALRGSGLAIYLYRAVFQAAMRAGFDLVVMSAQPKGALVLQTLLVCQKLGWPTYNGSFSDRHPSTVLGVDLRTCRDQIYERFGRLRDREHSPHHILFGKEVPQIQLPASFCPTPERVAASAALIDARPSVFQRLSPAEKNYLQEAVPIANWTAESPVVTGRLRFPPTSRLGAGAVGAGFGARIEGA